MEGCKFIKHLCEKGHPTHIIETYKNNQKCIKQLIFIYLCRYDRIDLYDDILELGEISIYDSCEPLAHAVFENKGETDFIPDLIYCCIYYAIINKCYDTIDYLYEKNKNLFIKYLDKFFPLVLVSDMELFTYFWKIDKIRCFNSIVKKKMRLDNNIIDISIKYIVFAWWYEKYTTLWAIYYTSCDILESIYEILDTQFCSKKFVLYTIIKSFESYIYSNNQDLIVENIKFYVAKNILQKNDYKTIRKIIYSSCGKKYINKTVIKQLDEVGYIGPKLISYNFAEKMLSKNISMNDLIILRKYDKKKILSNLQMYEHQMVYFLLDTFKIKKLWQMKDQINDYKNLIYNYIVGNDDFVVNHTLTLDEFQYFEKLLGNFMYDREVYILFFAILKHKTNYKLLVYMFNFYNDIIIDRPYILKYIFYVNNVDLQVAIKFCPFILECLKRIDHIGYVAPYSTISWIARWLYPKIKNEPLIKQFQNNYDIPWNNYFWDFICVEKSFFFHMIIVYKIKYYRNIYYFTWKIIYRYKYIKDKYVNPIDSNFDNLFITRSREFKNELLYKRQLIRWKFNGIMFWYFKVIKEGCKLPDFIRKPSDFIGHYGMKDLVEHDFIKKENSITLKRKKIKI